MNDTIRFFKDMKENGELSAKFEAKVEEIKAANELTNPSEIKIKAANALGYAITREQLDKLKAEAQELSDDDLEKVGGGVSDDPPDDTERTPEEQAEHERRMKEEQNCVLDYACWLFART
jgi:hypothetical protein